MCREMQPQKRQATELQQQQQQPQQQQMETGSRDRVS